MFNTTIFNIIGEGRLPRYFDMNAIVYALNRHDHDFLKNYAGTPILHGLSTIEYSKIGSEVDRGTAQIGTDNHHAREHTFSTSTQKSSPTSNESTNLTETEDTYDSQHYGLLQTPDFKDKCIIYTKFGDDVPAINNRERDGNIAGEFLGQEGIYSSNMSNWVKDLNPSQIEFTFPASNLPVDSPWDKIENHLRSFTAYEAISKTNPHGLTYQSLKPVDVLINLPLHSWTIVASMAPFINENEPEHHDTTAGYLSYFKDKYVAHGKDSEWIDGIGGLDEYKYFNSFHVPDGLRYDDYMKKEHPYYLHLPLYCCDDFSSPHTNMSWRIAKSHDIRFQCTLVQNGYQDYKGFYNYYNNNWHKANLQPHQSMKQYLAFPTISSPICSFLPMLIMGPAIPGNLSNSNENLSRYDNSIECRPFEYENFDNAVAETTFTPDQEYIPPYYQQDVVYNRYQFLFNKFYVSTIPKFSRMVLVLNGMFLFPNNYSDYNNLGIEEEDCPIIVVQLRSKDDQYDPFGDNTHNSTKHQNIFYKTSLSDVVINYSGEHNPENIAYKLEKIEIPLDAPGKNPGENLITPGNYTIQIFPRMQAYSIAKKYGFTYFGLTHAYIKFSENVSQFYAPIIKTFDVMYTTLGQLIFWEVEKSNDVSEFTIKLNLRVSNDTEENATDITEYFNSASGSIHFINDKKYSNANIKAITVNDSSKYTFSDRLAISEDAFEDKYEMPPLPGYKKSKSCFVKCFRFDNGGWDYSFDLRDITTIQNIKQGIRLSYTNSDSEGSPITEGCFDIKYFDIYILINNENGTYDELKESIFNAEAYYNWEQNRIEYTDQTHEISLQFDFFASNPMLGYQPVNSNWNDWKKCWVPLSTDRRFLTNPPTGGSWPPEWYPGFEEYHGPEGSAYRSKVTWSEYDTPEFIYRRWYTRLQPVLEDSILGGVRDRINLLSYLPSSSFSAEFYPYVLFPEYANKYGPIFTIENVTQYIDEIFKGFQGINDENHILLHIHSPLINLGIDSFRYKINHILHRMGFMIYPRERDKVWNAKYFGLSLAVHRYNWDNDQQKNTTPPHDDEGYRDYNNLLIESVIFDEIEK